MKFEVGERVRLAREYRVYAEDPLPHSDRARLLPIGHAGTVIGTDRSGDSAILRVEWDRHESRQGNHSLRVHESCLELELDQTEVDGAVESILKSMQGE